MTESVRRSTQLLSAVLAAAWLTSGCGLIVPVVSALTQSPSASGQEVASATSQTGSGKRPTSASTARKPGGQAASPAGAGASGEAGGSNLSNGTDSSNGTDGATGAGAQLGDGGTGSDGSAGFTGSGGSTGGTQTGSTVGSGDGNTGSTARSAGTIVVPAANPPKAGNALDDYIEDVKKSIASDQNQ